MMNVDYKGVEIGNLPANTSTTLVAGRAVTLPSGGNLALPLVGTRVLGLVKENYISGVINEITGQFGIFGSGFASVLRNGVATVRQSVYAGVSYSVYDQTLTYSIGDEIYAKTADGTLTNAALPAGTGPNGITSLRIGRVLKAPVNPANGDPMTISVEI